MKRKLVSNLFLDLRGIPKRNAVILLDETGNYIGDHPLDQEEESTEYYCGIFCPCFKEEDFTATLEILLQEQEEFPERSLEELLRKHCTSIGEKPGILLLEKIDWKNLKLTKESTARRLI